MTSKYPKFTYISDSILNDIFSDSEEECSFCNKSDHPSLKYWYTPNHLTICCECINYGGVNTFFSAYIGIEFHTIKAFVEVEGVSLKQAFELSYKTPPISIMGKGHEIYPWARHCDDFAIYHGVGEHKNLNKEIVNEVLGPHVWDEDEHWEGNNFIDPWDEITFHKFLCRHCNEKLYSVDYDI